MNEFRGVGRLRGDIWRLFVLRWMFARPERRLWLVIPVVRRRRAQDG